MAYDGQLLKELEEKVGLLRDDLVAREPNDGPAMKATLETDPKYDKMLDAVTGEELPLADPFVVEDHSGRWLRLVK